MIDGLDKCTDPECPACGCNASAVVKTVVKWGQASTRRRCDACGVVWTVSVAPPAPATPRPSKRKAAADERR